MRGRTSITGFTRFRNDQQIPNRCRSCASPRARLPNKMIFRASVTRRIRSTRSVVRRLSTAATRLSLQCSLQSKIDSFPTTIIVKTLNISHGATIRDRAAPGYGATSVCSPATACFGGGHGGGVGWASIVTSNGPRLARRQHGHAALLLLERLAVGEVDRRLQAGDVAVGRGLAVLPEREAGQLALVELQAHALRRRRRCATAPASGRRRRPPARRRSTPRPSPASPGRRRSTRAGSPRPRRRAARPSPPATPPSRPASTSGTPKLMW